MFENKKFWWIFGLLSLLALSTWAVDSQQIELPQTFNGLHQRFSIPYAADWGAAEVGPNIYWFNAPGTSNLPWEPIPTGGARIVIALPAQNALIGATFDPGNKPTISLAGQQALIYDSTFNNERSIVVAFQYPDGWLSIILLGPDPETYRAVLLAMADAHTYQPVELTPTPAATAAWTPPPLTQQFVLRPPDRIRILFPDGWEVVEGRSLGIVSRSSSVVFASSQDAVENFQSGQMQPDDLIIIILHKLVSLEMNLTDFTEILPESAALAEATFHLRPYHELDYPAWFIRIETHPTVSDSLSGLMIDTGVVPMFALVATGSPFEERAELIHAMLNSISFSN